MPSITPDIRFYSTQLNPVIYDDERITYTTLTLDDCTISGKVSLCGELINCAFDSWGKYWRYVYWQNCEYGGRNRYNIWKIIIQENKIMLMTGESQSTFGNLYEYTNINDFDGLINCKVVELMFKEIPECLKKMFFMIIINSELSYELKEPFQKYLMRYNENNNNDNDKFEFRISITPNNIFICYSNDYYENWNTLFYNEESEFSTFEECQLMMSATKEIKKALLGDILSSNLSHELKEPFLKYYTKEGFFS